tara:strand:+ start:1061 stop:1882 length:822 start_codon:yes stop_codon:yes gene_type:complete
MRRLQQLIAADLVRSGDKLFFSFKKNKFSCEITLGGILWKCTWEKPDGTTEELFRESSSIDGRPYIRTFESLTDWTETAIQETLNEYHTRYSSWKRVRHLRLGQPMETIYKHLQQSNLATKTNKDPDTVGLFEHIAALSSQVEQSKNNLAKWENWFRENHPDVKLPFSTIVQSTSNETSSSSSSSSSSLATSSSSYGMTQTQPFIFTGNNGNYMVLHEMNEPHEECKDFVNENASPAIQQAIVFDPPADGDATWQPVDDKTIKNFVHSFFNKQ